MDTIKLEASRAADGSVVLDMEDGMVLIVRYWGKDLRISIDRNRHAYGMTIDLPEGCSDWDWDDHDMPNTIYT